MAEEKILTKEQRIKRETTRLRGIYRDLDKNKAKVVAQLIKTAAFMSISLEDLQEIINRDGFIEEYNNGGGQSGKKQSEAVKIHIAMTKNFASIMKTLADLAPGERKKADDLDLMRNG